MISEQCISTFIIGNNVVLCVFKVIIISSQSVSVPWPRPLLLLFWLVFSPSQ